MKLWDIGAFAVVCVLAGCSNEPLDRTGSAGWVKPDATAAGFQVDSDACRRAAMVVPVKTSGPPAAERRRLYNECMIQRGWMLDPHLSKDSSLDIVNCRLPAAEQVQQMSIRDCMNRFGKIQ
jgi:hypothetical protein